MKRRGETQFPEAGVVREGPTLSVYSGTQPHPIYSGIWRRSTALGLNQYAQSPEGRAARHARRKEQP